jgi:hypothetical protein
MAIAITSPATGLFDPDTRDKAGIARLLTLAVLGAGSAAQRATARAEVAKRADFKVSFTTSDNAALANCMKLSGSSSRGVTFPAETLRTIRMVMRSRNDVDQFYQVVEQDVYGNDGTTPVLGDQRLIKAFMLDAAVYKQMGRVSVAAVVAVENTDGTNSAGAALGAFSSGAAALTFPPSRAGRIVGLTVSQNAYEAATSPGAASIAAFSPSAGTGSLNTYLTGTGAATDPPAADLVYAELELWPPPQVALVLNSTAVEVHARTSLSDVYVHNLEVFVGPAESVFFGA